MTLSGWDPSSLPPDLVARVQQDPDFGLRLLHRESRDALLRETVPDLTEDQLGELSSRLDEIASMSFQDALEYLRRHELINFL